MCLWLIPIPSYYRENLSSGNDKAVARPTFYHNDPSGCPIRLTDSTGEVQWAASYTAWGQIASLHVDQVDNPIRLQGQSQDGETGLRYNRYRYFDSTIGCFISQDPLGLLVGENLYLYALNVWGWFGPLGLQRKVKFRPNKFFNYLYKSFLH